MTRRALSTLLAALLGLVPFPACSQVGRITLEAPATPNVSLSASAINSATLSPAMPASLTPGLALTSPLAAPAAQPQLALSAEQFYPAAQIVPAKTVARQASNDDRFTPIQLLAHAAEQAASAPELIARLYDDVPASPDFATLSPIKTPQIPAPWRPSYALLKPAASVVNAWRLSRHERRINNLGPNERVTAEELSMQETLSNAHSALSTGRLQDALDTLSRLFKGAATNNWFRANSTYRPYQQQGHAYLRFIESTVKLAYEKAHARSRDAALIAEARAAARAGTLLGHEWRISQIQERDSAHCAHHALFNAISASAGFVYPLSVHRFIERAREVLNVHPAKVTSLSGSHLAALEHSIGIKIGVDVGEGMGPDSIKKWAQLLGLSFEARGPPRGDAQWSALLGRGQEVLISLRMFHENFKHSPAERELYGHQYEMIHHEVYLLGAFDSPSRGERLYMVQDSGSGATDFYTASELSAVASDIQIVGTQAPVALP